MPDWNEPSWVYDPVTNNPIAVVGPSGQTKYLSSGNVIPVTVSRTVTNLDNGSTLVYSGSGAITLTVPAGLTANFGCAFVQMGSGQITITGSGVTVNNVSGFTKTSGQYAVLAMISVGTNYAMTGSGA